MKAATMENLNFYVPGAGRIHSLIVCSTPFGHRIFTYTVLELKIDFWPGNMLLLKDSQSLPNFFETWSKFLPYESVILTKSQRKWVKNVDFLIIAYFWPTCQF